METKSWVWGVGGRGGSGRGDCSGCEFKSVIGFYSYYGQVRLGHLFILDQIGIGNGPYVLGNGPQVLGNDNGPPVLGNGPHVLGIMSQFGIMSHSGLCRSA